ncbi:MAG TPA: HAMP domain-containing sensor histidine kinase [Ramlibacter sp.]|nr:HAMP domain-containing sensor histidine kinase [Ramlibacter sp.]
MKVPDLSLPSLEMPRLGLASFRRRLLFRGVFALLALATLALALVLLQDEKERSHANYRQAFRKTQAEVMARLRHPAGVLALLNPSAQGEAVPLRPLLLPFGALDFDDQNKAQQAVETAGCAVRWPDGSALCAAVGNNPYAGGFIYLVGSFAAGPLAPRERGMLDLETVHRARISLTMRGDTQRWIAPFELLSAPDAPLVRGRLTGFADSGEATLAAGARPLRDFRGWLWQAGCDSAAAAGIGSGASGSSSGANAAPDCPRRTFVSIRLPVEAFRDALFAQPRPAWPPADLDRIRVRLEMLAPAPATAPLFDSDAAGAVPPPSLHDLRQALLPGETLTLRKAGSPAPLAVLRGQEDPASAPSPLMLRLIRRLPVASPAAPLRATESIATAAGLYEATLAGDARGVERVLAAAATRMAWFVAAMLGAIVLAWAVIEIGLIRRIAVLTKRAAAVSHNVQDGRGAQHIGALEVSDLRGSDELGILAGGLADLLQRVKDDVQREQLRARQERDMLQAVGHEILSPLQSLMVLHPNAGDAGHRYVQRMQQAVKVLYGQASPSEALAAAQLALQPLDIDRFLDHVARNAHFAGIEGVAYARLGTPVAVRADEFALEDVITHLLRNAERFRVAGSPITLALRVEGGQAHVTVHNQGPAIDPAMLEAIFSYGVSADAGETAEGHRGQGLFVARTWVAKMGGTIVARNVEDGVVLAIALPLAG